MAIRTRAKSKPPQQILPLARDVIVLRKIDMRFKGSPKQERENILEILGMAQLEPGVHEQEMPWFRDGYVTNDQPRDSIVADKLISTTIGFAIARTDTGEILKEFGVGELKQADQAVANARVMPSFDFELDPEDEDDEEPEADAAPVPAESDEAPIIPEAL